MPKPSFVATAARFLSGPCWLFCAAATIVVGIVFIRGLLRAESAAQEAAVAASCSCALIGLYVFCRCVEKVGRISDTTEYW